MWREEMSLCRNRRKDNWDLLRSLASINDSPWIVMGDFNDILNHREKRGGVAQPNWLVEGFRRAVWDSGLVDLGFQGCPFTWERGRESGLWVQERLNRMLGNGDWVARHKDARVVHLDSVVSDHFPIILHLYRVEGTRSSKRFRFENLWTNYGESEEVVRDSWNKEVGVSIQRRISNTSKSLLQWGREKTNGCVYNGRA
ncbi:uncharacterized protein LOC8272290 [Ricinus communis]|uniref:uncharacterized protein LOC8272290 n=1 Tax=Ricinus communis TaxID=3988 RepID=UPI0007725FA3|nr:uncharacterized protein LOC8272290 [Ricinus communis]|eukprot:XP_015579884.1 uncharacterized protein LOC8272290 [Ricinus communis]